MINENIELTSNFQVIYLENFDLQSLSNLYQLNNLNNIKIIVKIKSINKLSEFIESNILNLVNVHVSLEMTRNIYLLMNTHAFLERCILKSLKLEEKVIRLDFFLSDQVPEMLIKNNIKILERVNYMTDDVKIHSKNFEILYQAKTLLNEVKKKHK